MKEFKFRVLIDTLEEDNAFRDISIDSSFTFDKLSDAIIVAFGFGGGQMASFYMSNEDWDKGQEIGLMDMSGENGEFEEMINTKIVDKVEVLNQKLLYVYDFLSMWCFFVELIEINEIDSSKDYPMLELEYGQAPDEGSKQMDILSDLGMEDEDESDYDEFEDEFNSFGNIDDYDI